MRRGINPFLGLLASMLSLALAAPVLPAADYEQRQLDGGATLRLGSDRVDNDLVEMALGLERTLTLSVEGPAPLVIQNEQGLIEAETSAVGTIWDYKQEVRRDSLPGNRERWQLTFKIDPRAEKGKKYPVEHSLQLIPISFQAGSPPVVRTAPWRPITVRITTLVENPDRPSLSQLRDITGIETTPAEATRRRLVEWLTALGLGLLALAGALVLWQYVRKRVGHGAELLPTDWALRELDKIEAQRLPENGRVERYHTLLSDVVRQYLERSYRLRAPQQTTSEFLSTMQSWPQLPPAQQALLRDFLERCDLVKFAQARPSLEECWAVGSMARALVEQKNPLQAQAS
jgi:hypothetical protein